VAGSYAAVAEAMALGERLGLPMDAVITALQGGAAGSWALSHRANSMLKAHYPLGFRMSLHHKDLGIALDAAGDVNLDLPVTQLVADLENGLMEQGHGDEDVSALHRHYCTKSW
jgi:3-hydroxyisobutyrate dehydrogenase/2-hydroxy-3-oxopropionate reductase